VHLTLKYGKRPQTAALCCHACAVAYAWNILLHSYTCQVGSSPSTQ
jgi:hypothetical protein